MLTEPALTNAGFILPEAGFHEALRPLTRAQWLGPTVSVAHTADVDEYVAAFEACLGDIAG